MFAFCQIIAINVVTSSADLIPPWGERSWLSVCSNFAGSIRGIFLPKIHMFCISARESLFMFSILTPLIKYIVRSVTDYSFGIVLLGVWVKQVGSTWQTAASARKEAVLRCVELALVSQLGFYKISSPKVIFGTLSGTCLLSTNWTANFTQEYLCEQTNDLWLNGTFFLYQPNNSWSTNVQRRFSFVWHK